MHEYLKVDGWDHSPLVPGLKFCRLAVKRGLNENGWLASLVIFKGQAAIR